MRLRRSADGAALEPSRRAASGMERELPEVRYREGRACDLPIAVRMVRARGRLREHRQPRGLEAVLQVSRRRPRRVERLGAWREKRSGMVRRDARARDFAAVATPSGRSALRAGAASASRLPADLLHGRGVLRAEMAWLDRRLATLHRPCDRGDATQARRDTLYAPDVVGIAIVREDSDRLAADEGGLRANSERLSRPLEHQQLCAICVQERGLGDRAGARGTYRRQAGGNGMERRHTSVLQLHPDGKKHEGPDN